MYILEIMSYLCFFGARTALFLGVKAYAAKGYNNLELVSGV
jgi:hypothetical protein